MKRLAGAIVLLVVAVSPAAAQAPGLTLRADDRPTGHIGLTLTGPAGATLAVAETTIGNKRLGDVTLDAAGRGALADAGTWRCSPRLREFSAEGTAADGTPLAADATVRTPSCKNRYRVAVFPKKPRANTRVTVRVTDTFRLGGARGRVCVNRCRSIRIPAGKATATKKLQVSGSGRTRVTARLGGRRATARIRIRRAKHLTLLATGDSMIQIIDSFLKSRLSGDNVSVRSDAKISSGLSKSFFFNWPKHARRQPRTDVTVMFIGANDGFPFGSAACCGKRWVKAYAQRVSRMMAIYERHGSEIYWCLLPAPREGNFRRVFAAVNKAVVKAARKHPKTAHVVDFPKTFTPGFRYTDTLNGRVVRQDDGVHFNTTGASIAASMIIRRMRRDGVI